MIFIAELINDVVLRAIGHRLEYKSKAADRHGKQMNGGNVSIFFQSMLPS